MARSPRIFKSGSAKGKAAGGQQIIKRCRCNWPVKPCFECERPAGHVGKQRCGLQQSGIDIERVKAVAAKINHTVGVDRERG